MMFRHPSNGHVVTAKHAALWCLLFGGFYFMKHDAWAHAIVSLIVAIGTGGVAWVIYPFFAKRIVRNTYLRRGWVEVSDTLLAA